MSIGNITITMFKAILTYDVCTFSTMDPHFIAYFIGGNVPSYKSKVRMNEGKYPKWNETFIFPLTNEKVIRIDLYHEKEIIGTSEIQVSEILKKLDFDAEYAVFHSMKPRGQIIVHIKFTPLVTNFSNNNNLNVNSNVSYNNSFTNPNFNNNIPYSNSMNPNNYNNQNTNVNYSNTYSNTNPNMMYSNTNINQGQTGFSNQTFTNTEVIKTTNPSVKGYDYSYDNTYSNQSQKTNNPNTNFSHDVNNNINSYPNLNSVDNFSSQQGQTLYTKTLNYFKVPFFFQNSSRSIFSYDFYGRRWNQVNNNGQEFFPQYLRATELPDKSYLLTGGDNNGTSSNSTTHYLEGAFYPKAKMTYPRKAHCAIYLKGFVWVFGGFGNSGVFNLCEKFDMNSGKWSDISPMHYSRAYGTAMVYSEAYIFIIGGFRGEKIDNSVEIDRIERYDVNANIFDEFKIKLPLPVYGCIATLVSDNKILIAGGWSEERGNSKSVFTIDLTNGNLAYLPDLPTAGWTVLPPYYLNGTLYMFQQGEETTGLPDMINYDIKTPLY